MKEDATTKEIEQTNFSSISGNLEEDFSNLEQARMLGNNDWGMHM